MDIAVVGENGSGRRGEGEDKDVEYGDDRLD